MNLDFDIERFSLAIDARKIMLYEQRTTSEAELNQRINEKVAEPTRKFLEALAQSNPGQIVCFASKPFNFEKAEGCTCQDIYLFGALNHAAYLGTVFNKKAVATLVKQLPREEQDDFKLRRTIVRRFHTFYVIPLTTNEVNDVQLLKAVKRYLQSCSEPVQNLAKATICFLSSEKGAELDWAICREAKRRA